MLLPPRFRKACILGYDLHLRLADDMGHHLRLPGYLSVRSHRWIVGRHLGVEMHQL